MPYGTVKVDNVTFTNNSVDATTTFSGIYASTTNNLTLSGTATAATFTGTTANFTNLNAQNIGVTTSLSGLAITGGTAGFTTITGTTVTGTTANFVTVSGTTVTGTTANFTSGIFTSLSGTTVTFTSGIITSGTGALTLNGQSDLRFADSDSSHYIALQAPATVTANVTMTLPAADGTNGQVLTTNGSGTLSFTTASGGASQWTTTGSDIYYTTGKVLVGTSTTVAGIGASAKLQVRGNTSTAGAKLSFQRDQAAASIGAGEEVGQLVFASNDGGDYALITARSDGASSSTSDCPGRIEFSTTADGGSSPTERMRIKSDGTVVVNATTTTYAPTSFAVRGIIENTIATYNNGDVFVRFLSGTQGSGTLRGSIETNGISVFYSTASDVRLKENIQDAQEAGALLDSINVRSFDWKESGIHQDFGFIAQEIVQVYPEAVCHTTDEDRLLALDYSKLVPLLVKEIQSLRTRLAALETA